MISLVLQACNLSYSIWGLKYEDSRFKNSLGNLVRPYIISPYLLLYRSYIDRQFLFLVSV